jgi:hypothetical protein
MIFTISGLLSTWGGLLSAQENSMTSAAGEKNIHWRNLLVPFTVLSDLIFNMGAKNTHNYPIFRPSLPKRSALTTGEIVAVHLQGFVSQNLRGGAHGPGRPRVV